MSKKIAIVCAGGGTGKTQLSVGLACTWAEQGKSVLLIDADPQKTKSAEAWLDKFPEDNPATERLSFVKAELHELAQSLHNVSVDDDLIIIDTPPRLDDAAVSQIASQVDLVLIPGGIGGDIESVSETASTLLKLTSTPVLVVANKINPAQMAKSQDMTAPLLSIGAGVVSTKVRHYTIADEARLVGDVPTRLKGDKGTKHRNDLAGVAAEIEQRLGGI